MNLAVPEKSDGIHVLNKLWNEHPSVNELPVPVEELTEIGFQQHIFAVFDEHKHAGVSGHDEEMRFLIWF